MRRRIRLHQIQEGMFVDELEAPQERQSGCDTPFLISSKADLERIMRTQAMSIIIDTSKGRDLDLESAAVENWPPAWFEAQLSAEFSAGQIGLARATIEQVRPHLYNVLTEARLRGAVDMDAANQTVDRVMTEAISNSGALLGLAKLKDRDEGTFLHSLTVSALMITFGRCLGFDEQYVRQLGLGGMVHDLGKMALPAGLLTKPGKLTKEEVALVRTHPVRGYNMLKRTAFLEQPILDVCLFHHEKFDGGGYPSNLAGKKIPIAARIAAICDVYDALTTVRPYKHAQSQAEAVDTMLRSKGHFDPELLKAFVSKMVIAGAIS